MTSILECAAIEQFSCSLQMRDLAINLLKDFLDSHSTSSNALNALPPLARLRVDLINRNELLKKDNTEHVIVLQTKNGNITLLWSAKSVSKMPLEKGIAF